MHAMAFTSRRRLVLGTLVAACLAPACQAPPARPNVLLVTLDGVRPDHLGCYGAKDVATPSLDAVARAGVAFTRAYTPVPLTLPAHVTLFTGLEPPAHGVVGAGLVAGELGVPTLAERLAAAGYDTAAFVASFELQRVFGLARGFAEYDDGARDDAELRGLASHSAGAAEQVDAALAWLARPRGRPFFLWLQLDGARGPLAPASPSARSFAARPYDGRLAAADAQLGRLLAALGARGLERDTLVVITSAHGEGLGEHGERGHGLLLHDATLRVPLILRWAGHLPVGRRDERLAALSDVTPTLLDLAGLAPNDAHQGRRLFGNDPGDGERVLWAQSEVPQRFGWAPLRAVRRGAWKYVAGARAEMFDTRRDAGELQDARARFPRLASELGALLARSPASLRRAPAAAAPASDARERLRALGYVTGSPDAASPDPRDRIAAYEESVAALERLESGGDALPAAAHAVRALSRRYPRNGALHLALGCSLERRGRLDEAQRAYERASGCASTRLAGLARMAAVAARRDDHESELRAARELARAAPGFAPAQRRLGDALARAGQGAEAEAAYRESLRLEPRSRLARLGLAHLLFDLGRRDEATAAMVELEREFPGDAAVQALREPSPPSPSPAS